MGLGRILTIISTTVVMLIGLTLIGGGIWLVTRGGGVECVKYFQYPLFAVGATLFAVAFTGFLGAVVGIPLLLYIYLLLTLVAIIALGVFTGLAFLATSKSVQPVSGVGYSVYRVPDFSSWLQSYVADPEQWQKLSSCIRDSNVCSVSFTNITTPGNVYDVDLTPLQSGCCMRPQFCDSASNVTSMGSGVTLGAAANELLNATIGTNISGIIPYLTPPGAPPTNSSADCQLFKPDPLGLCYPCETCKGGLLKTLQDAWRTIAYFNLSLLATLVVVYFLGCCALRSARKHGLDFV